MEVASPGDPTQSVHHQSVSGIHHPDPTPGAGEGGTHTEGLAPDRVPGVQPAQGHSAEDLQDNVAMATESPVAGAAKKTAEATSVQSGAKIFAKPLTTGRKVDNSDPVAKESVAAQKEKNSFVRTVKKEAEKLEPDSSVPNSRQSRRKLKKGIFISYSPDAGFLERKFVTETVRELKENNLAEDIWFDKDEKNTDSPCWFSMRMEAVEKSRAAVMVLSDSYFTCPVSVYEGKTLLERYHSDSTSIRLYPILFNLTADTEIPQSFVKLLPQAVDLTKEHVKISSLAEKTSIAIGALMDELERHASIHAAPSPVTPPDTDFTGQYKSKKICQWGANDLQEWLFKMGIKEFYRQSLAENMVDGFLLMSLTDQDMVNHLGIDSRVVRKKIMQQILVTLDKEHKSADSWHLRARTQRGKPNSVYLIYDPADVRLAQNLKQDLNRKGVTVIHHNKLGQSKDEFLRANGPQMATAAFVLLLLTDAATASPFVFHEILFGDWLGKKLITVMFKNTWHDLRPSLKAVLGDSAAVDFETKMYHESMSILEHHIRPLRAIPGVVLEQAYLNKMAEGLKPLSVLANSSEALRANDWKTAEKNAEVFISFQWDMQSKVEDLRKIFEANGFQCWADINPTMSLQRGHSNISIRSGQTIDSAADNLQMQITRNMKLASVVVCCVTPKYLQSDNCIKDLTLAESLHKPVIPIMLRFCPWPPEGAPPGVRKIFVKHSPVDLSNEKLFKQNIHVLLDRIKKVTPQR